jgi:hypothetical protein
VLSLLLLLLCCLRSLADWRGQTQACCQQQVCRHQGSRQQECQQQGYQQQQQQVERRPQPLPLLQLLLVVCWLQQPCWLLPQQHLQSRAGCLLPVLPLPPPLLLLLLGVSLLQVVLAAGWPTHTGCVRWPCLQSLGNTA